MKPYYLSLTITVYLLIVVNLDSFAQSEKNELTLDHAINTLSLESVSAQIERLYYSNDLLEFENYKKERLPSVSFSLSPINLNRSIKLLQNPTDGSYSYVNDYSNSSSIGVSVSQKVGFTGGELSIGSNLNYLNEFSQKRHTFNTTPFTIGYSQQLWGGTKLHKMEKKIEQRKNLIVVKSYCAKICQIQTEVLELFLNAVQNKLESELAELNFQTSDSLIYISKIKLDHGNITEYDYKQIELQALNIRYSLDKAVKNHDESKLQLCTYLGLDPKDIKIVVPDFHMPSFLDNEVALYYVKSNNVFYAEKQIEEMEAEKNLFSKKMNSNLNGSININYGANQYANNFMDAYRNSNARAVISVGLQIPIFKWGVNKNNLRIAENSFQATILTIEKDTKEFEDDICKKINTYNHSINLWITAEKAYALAKEQYQILVHKFYLETVSIFELTNAQKEQSDAMERYYAAIKDVYTNYYSLRQLALYDFIEEKALEDILVNN